MADKLIGSRVMRSFRGTLVALADAASRFKVDRDGADREFIAKCDGFEGQIVKVRPGRRSLHPRSRLARE
jgi:hypothetical protein